MNWTGKKKNILKHTRENYGEPRREIKVEWIEDREEDNLDIIGLKIPMPMYLSSPDSKNSCNFSNFRLPSPINKKSRSSTDKKRSRENSVASTYPGLKIGRDNLPLDSYLILRAKYKKLNEKVNTMEKEIDLVGVKLSILEFNLRNCKTKVKSI